MGNFNRGGGDRGPRRDFGRRDFGRSSFGGRGGGGGREMHKAVCSNCGKNCEVPFEPTGGKPVYCSECFEQKGGGGESRRFEDRGGRRPEFGRRDEPRPQNNDQFDSINRKLDKILGMLSAAPTTIPVKEEKVVEVKAEEKVVSLEKPVEKKAKTSKKKASVAKE
jgi:CxxC-x17-CxxC domain-containing protein